MASYVSFVMIIGLVVLNVMTRTGRSEDRVHFERSIAVLPFDNMSNDREFDYLAEAHVALAFVKTYYDWNWKGGEQSFRRAISHHRILPGFTLL